MSTEKLPPHDIDAEEAVIGSLMLNGAIQSCNSLQSSDFYSERNRWIYDACLRLHERGVSINPITLANELSDKLDECGGSAFLSHLVGVCPTSLDLSYYAEIVGRLSFYRKMIAISEQISVIGYQASSDVNQSVDKADELLLELRKKTSPSAIITPKEKGSLLHDRYTDLYLKEGDAAISTGLRDLDKILGGGFYPGELTILGARTGMGKTTLLQNFANAIARIKNVLIFSCEMGVESLGDRDVASIMGLPINTIRWGKYEKKLYDDILDAVGEISESNVYTYDKSPISTATIMQASLNMQLRYGLGAIVVDYLGLIDDEIGENRNITLGYMTKKLKQVARVLKVPIIVAHQLSRTLESRPDKRPMLSDLRESGHIEEDADVVVFLYRDSYYFDKEAWKSVNAGIPYPDGITEVIIAKQRQGESNRTVRVKYDEAHQQFYDLVKEAQYG